MVGPGRPVRSWSTPVEHGWSALRGQAGGRPRHRRPRDPPSWGRRGLPGRYRPDGVPARSSPRRWDPAPHPVPGRRARPTGTAGRAQSSAGSPGPVRSHPAVTSMWRP